MCAEYKGAQAVSPRGSIGNASGVIRLRKRGKALSAARASRRLFDANALNLKSGGKKYKCARALQVRDKGVGGNTEEGGNDSVPPVARSSHLSRELTTTTTTKQSNNKVSGSCKLLIRRGNVSDNSPRGFLKTKFSGGRAAWWRCGRSSSSSPSLPTATRYREEPSNRFDGGASRCVSVCVCVCAALLAVLHSVRSSFP